MFSRFRFLFFRHCYYSTLFVTNSNKFKPIESHHIFNKNNQGASFWSSRSIQSRIQSNSKQSHYISVDIQCRKCDAETLSDALLSFGASSASKDDLADYQDIDKVSITCIFPDCKDLRMCISQAVGSIGLKYVPTYKVSKVDECDWVKNALENFHPIEITAGLWIVPKWKPSPNLQTTNIIIDPGMAFGTGEHPTTKMCMILLHGLVRGGEHILDYGTGSGVLGIAAIKLGAGLCMGIDIDSQAITAASQNIALNNIDPCKMRVYLVGSKPNVPLLEEENTGMPNKQELHSTELEASKGTFDIVIANVLLNPLVELVEDIVSYAKPGAKVGLSGILSEQVQQIKEVYDPFLCNISINELEGWACICGTKKENLDI